MRLLAAPPLNGRADLPATWQELEADARTLGGLMRTAREPFKSAPRKRRLAYEFAFSPAQEVNLAPGAAGGIRDDADFGAGGGDDGTGGGGGAGGGGGGKGGPAPRRLCVRALEQVPKAQRHARAVLHRR